MQSLEMFIEDIKRFYLINFSMQKISFVLISDTCLWKSQLCCILQKDVGDIFNHVG